MRTARVRCDFNKNLGPLNIRNMSVGQGGLSPDPMWEDRVPEIRALNPNLVRFWVQEYFNVDCESDIYDYDAIDRSIRMILATGGTPLISLNMKPKSLYPVIDERILEPADFGAWERFITDFVGRFVGQGHTGWYWEVIGETDAGEGGGCPFLGTPETYPPFYDRTAKAIVNADPTARVGGPALAWPYSPILPALLEYCEANGAPLHFVSWHIYATNPLDIRKTIDHARGELAKHPTLNPETILDEWSVVWESKEARDLRFLPCFIPEAIWHMKEAGLDHSCYYHIRDYHVEQRRFEPFFTKAGAAFMARWWNRMPQWGGLFDYQNTVRPSYFSFKLVKRLEGDRLELVSDDDKVHGFLTCDGNYSMYVLMFWNFSSDPVHIELEFENVPKGVTGIPFVLDVDDASNDENRRIRPLDKRSMNEGSHSASVECEPYGVHCWYFKGDRWDLGN